MKTSIKNLILDMDGVLWRGDTPMPGLVDFFGILRQQNINFILATNNATKTAVQYSEKIAAFGLNIPPEQILNSAETTAEYLSRHFDRGTAVYIIGEKGLHDALIQRGFEIVSPKQVLKGTRAPLVVVGFTRHAVYNDLAMGALLIQKGAQFIGTNPDPTFPSEIGLLPGAGSLLALIKTATGIEPTIIGKPHPIIFQEAVKRLGGETAATAMVGDRLTTDIAGGKAAGLQTILLLSGVTNRSDLKTSPIQPNFIFNNIVELGAHLLRR